MGVFIKRMPEDRESCELDLLKFLHQRRFIGETFSSEKSNEDLWKSGIDTEFPLVFDANSIWLRQQIFSALWNSILAIRSGASEQYEIRDFLENFGADLFNSRHYKIFSGLSPIETIEVGRNVKILSQSQSNKLLHRSLNENSYRKLGGDFFVVEIIRPIHRKDRHHGLDRHLSWSVEHKVRLACLIAFREWIHLGQDLGPLLQTVFDKDTKPSTESEIAPLQIRPERRIHSHPIKALLNRINAMAKNDREVLLRSFEHFRRGQQGYPSESLLPLRTALEMLLLHDLDAKTELFFRFRLHAAILLGRSCTNRQEYFKKFSYFYELRSTAVHGGHVSIEKEEFLDPFRRELIDIYEKVVNLGFVPRGNDFIQKILGDPNAKL